MLPVAGRGRVGAAGRGSCQIVASRHSSSSSGWDRPYGSPCRTYMSIRRSYPTSRFDCFSPMRMGSRVDAGSPVLPSPPLGPVRHMSLMERMRGRDSALLGHRSCSCSIVTMDGGRHRLEDNAARQGGQGKTEEHGDERGRRVLSGCSSCSFSLHLPTAVAPSLGKIYRVEVGEKLWRIRHRPPWPPVFRRHLVCRRTRRAHGAIRDLKQQVRGIASFAPLALGLPDPCGRHWAGNLGLRLRPPFCAVIRRGAQCKRVSAVVRLTSRSQDLLKKLKMAPNWQEICGFALDSGAAELFLCLRHSAARMTTRPKQKAYYSPHRLPVWLKLPLAGIGA